MTLRPSSGAHASTVHRPSTARVLEKQRVPARLPHARQVLPVHKQSDAPELLFRQETENHVRLADGSVRILFKALASGVVPLDSDPPDVLRLPHPDDSCAVTRRQRYVLFNGIDGLASSHIGVGRGYREWFFAQRPQELEPDVCGRVGQGAEDVRWRSLHMQRIIDARGEQCGGV